MVKKSNVNSVQNFFYVLIYVRFLNSMVNGFVDIFNLHAYFSSCIFVILDLSLQLPLEWGHKATDVWELHIGNLYTTYFEKWVILRKKL